jgi:hypothetical protein
MYRKRLYLRTADTGTNPDESNNEDIGVFYFAIRVSFKQAADTSNSQFYKFMHDIEST